jgi:hypothetical protein
MNSALIAILLAIIPDAPAFIQDIRNLFTKYTTTLTPAQIAAIVQAASLQSDAAFQDALTVIQADQAAHVAAVAAAPKAA